MGIVVLNSGGLDSVVLLHKIREERPDEDIHCLHFDYGQNNRLEEYSAAVKSSAKVGARFIPIHLPNFNWTSSGFYGGKFVDSASQELELRNLIFLSYAFSYCLSKDIHEIYVAFLKEYNYYKDTSPQFVIWVNSLIKPFSLSVKAPLQDMGLYKDCLGTLIKRYGINKDDFFSCNTPSNGNPCGICPDCECINELFKPY